MDTDGSSMYSKIGSVSGSVVSLGNLQVANSDYNQSRQQTTPSSSQRSQSSSIEERRQRLRQRRDKAVTSASKKQQPSSAGGATKSSRRCNSCCSVTVGTPKLWLLCQLAIVGAFALSCAVMRALRSGPDAADRVVWLHLVFYTTQLSVCQGKYTSGCLENGTYLTYRTTGEEFHPLIHQNSSQNADTNAFSLQHLELNDRGVRVKESAAYRVFGQVRFVDSVRDLAARLTIMVNNDYWLHCQIPNHAPATRCVIYGVRYLRAGDLLTFKCAEKFRLISIAPQDTYFSIEKR